MNKIQTNQEPARRSDNGTPVSEGGKVHILIATGIFPPDIGGPATMLLGLTNGLIKKGIKIKVITYSSQDKKETLSNGLKIYGIKKNTLLSKLKYFLKLFKLSRTADLIYTTDTYSVGYFAYLIRKFTGKKYILRFTGDSAWETARGNDWITDYIVDFQNIKYDNKIEKLKKRRNKILFNADRIIVDSEFNKVLAEKILNNYCHPEFISGSQKYRETPKQVRRDIQKDKIIIINNVICNVCHADISLDPEKKDSKINYLKQKYSPHGEKLLMTACRLTSWKGVDQIIEILPELIKQIGPLSFLILGTGPEKIKLEFLAEKYGVLEEVHFLGVIEQKEIINYYQSADVFVLNSQYEGMSNTLLEVMQAGVAIIASNCGGNMELIENNKTGILVEYGNKNDLLNSLTKLLTDKNLAKEFAQNAYQKSLNFSWPEVVDKTMDVIKK